MSKTVAAKKAAKQVATTAASLIGFVAIVWVVKVALLVANILLYIKTYEWIRHLDRDPTCGCSKDWRKSYVLWFPPMALLVAIFMAFLPPGISAIISLILLAGWVVFVVAAAGYVSFLHASKCTCATAGTGDEVLHMYAYLPVIAWALSILFALILLLIIGRKAK